MGCGMAREDCFKVTEEYELMEFLQVKLPDKSRNGIKALLKHGQISIDNQVVSQFNYPLKIGQQVKVTWTKPAAENCRAQKVNIIFEDQHLIVVDKQAGLLSIATGREQEQTAYSILSAHVKRENPDNKIFVVHRLDRDTSGVMMFAKSENVQQLLQSDWKRVVVERSYICVVEGLVRQAQGTITSWLKESKTLVMYSSRNPDSGQKAVTHYQVLKQTKSYSLLEVKLETGRKNQIRVHMHDLGHSIIGDKKYGAKTNPVKRLGLHAKVLAFYHPITGERLRYESPVPQEFLRLFKQSAR